MRIRRMTTAQLINLVSEQAPGNRYRRMIDDSSRIEVLGAFDIGSASTMSGSYILVRIVNNYGRGGRDRKVTLLTIAEFIKPHSVGNFYQVWHVADDIPWLKRNCDYPSTLPRKTIDRMVAREVAREEARCGTT